EADLLARRGRTQRVEESGVQQQEAKQAEREDQHTPAGAADALKQAATGLVLGIGGRRWCSGRGRRSRSLAHGPLAHALAGAGARCGPLRSPLTARPSAPSTMQPPRPNSPIGI